MAQRRERDGHRVAPTSIRDQFESLSPRPSKEWLKQERIVPKWRDSTIVWSGIKTSNELKEPPDASRIDDATFVKKS